MGTIKEMPEIITFGKTELIKEKFVPVKNEWIKPIGGIWGSTYEKGNSIASDWERWCIEENHAYKFNEATIFTLRQDAQIYTIDNFRDLRELAEKYPFEDRWLDFEKISKHYDAIHLTQWGQSLTRYTKPYDLYGWDVECYLILNFGAIDKQRAARREQHGPERG